MSTPNEDTMTDQTTPPPAADENPLLRTLFATASEEAPAAAKTEPKETKPQSNHGMSLHEVLAQAEAKEEGKDDEKKDDAAAEPEKKEEPAAEEPKPAPAKRVKVRRAKEEPVAPLPPPVAPASAEPPKEQKKEVDPEEGLLDEEKDLLKLARFAEKKNPKYAGRAEKLTAFFKKNAEFTAKKLAEDPEYDFSEDNPEYRAFLAANRPPALAEHERRALEREMIKEEVMGETRAELEKRQADEQTRRTHEQLAAKHKQEATKFWRDTAVVALPDDLKAAMKEHGAAKAKEMFPFEYDVSEQVMTGAAASIEEFLLISSGVRKFDLNNQTHKGIADFIEQECADFAKNGGDARVRGGKRFVSRSDFQRIPPEQRGGYWTFSNAEIVDLAKVGTKRAIAQVIAAEYAKREKQGWVRSGKAAPSKAAPAPTPASSARPAPSAGSTPPEKKPAIGSDNPVMGALGLV